jgi:hypothetical protein
MPSQELVLKSTPQAVKVAADGPPASGAQGPSVRTKKWEEVEAEDRALVVSEGGDPGAEMVILSRCTVRQVPGSDLQMDDGERRGLHGARGNSA